MLKIHEGTVVGLLHPSSITDAGYRLYDDTALEQLQHIMLFRELKFSLKEIGQIINGTDFDRNRALEQQIQLLTLKRDNIENLITFARGIQGIGVRNMDFSAFDSGKLDEYAAQAKATWGKTDAYQEYEQKTEKLTEKEKNEMGSKVMEFFATFGELRDKSPESEEVQKQVGKLQQYITDNFYTCTDEILACLGRMYNGGGSMTENIDRVGGAGTADFVAAAIGYHCKM